MSENIGSIKGKKDTYNIKVQCINCSRIAHVEIERGTTLEASQQTCPHCGCKTLKRAVV